MRLANRISRLEHSAGAERICWFITLPDTPLKELRRIEREIKTNDMLIIFDFRAGDKPRKSDAKVDELLKSIRNKGQAESE